MMSNIYSIHYNQRDHDRLSAGCADSFSAYAPRN